MSIAMTVMPQSGRVSPRFDTASNCMVWGRDGTAAEPGVPVKLDGDLAERIAILRKHGVEWLICGAIANDDVRLLLASGIKVCPFVAGRWDDVWRNWRCGAHFGERNLLPGCRGQHRRCCRRWMPSTQALSINQPKEERES